MKNCVSRQWKIAFRRVVLCNSVNNYVFITLCRCNNYWTKIKLNTFRISWTTKMICTFRSVLYFIAFNKIKSYELMSCCLRMLLNDDHTSFFLKGYRNIWINLWKFRYLLRSLLTSLVLTRPLPNVILTLSVGNIDMWVAPKSNALIQMTNFFLYSVIKLLIVNSLISIICPSIHSQKH